LRRLGWRAFGVEIEPQFVEAGQIINSAHGAEFPVLSLAEDERTVFPDAFFDFVISDQVLEHVRDLGKVASEISRVLKPGGYCFHRLPARFRPIEPHYGLPFVHWLPKGRSRFAAISALVAVGIPVPLPHGMPRRRMVEIIYRYSCEHTWYRSPATIAAEFARHGVLLDFVAAQRRWVRRRLGVPRRALAALPILFWMLGNFHQCRTIGRKGP
jgi:SAM-dependent methyltransferase